MAPEHLLKPEVWEPHLTLPQHFQHPNCHQIMSITPYLHLGYQRAWPSFHLLSAGPPQEPHNGWPLFAGQLQGLTASTASSCMPHQALPTWASAKMSLPLPIPFSPHLYFWLLLSYLSWCSWRITSSQRISLTKILYVNLPPLDTVISQFGILYLVPIISSVRIKIPWDQQLCLF